MRSEGSSAKRLRTLRNKTKARNKGRYRRVKKSDLGKAWARKD